MPIIIDWLGLCGLETTHSGGAGRRPSTLVPSQARRGFRHFAGGNKYYWYTLTGGTDNGEFSTRVSVNGQTGTAAVGGPADYAGIKANAAPLTGTIKIQVPARAAVYLVAGF